MTTGEKPQGEMITVPSTRFGDLTIAKETIIHFPTGVIGFPQHKNFVMLEYKPPFCWLHSVEDAQLAFVVVDGFEFGENYSVKPPVGDANIDLKEEDEFAILVIVTVRPDPKMTTANLKAPLFVNLRNRKGVQVIFDDRRYDTRFPLWASENSGASEGALEDPKKD